MWSDFESVINFIENERTRLYIHVLHRTNEIRNFTKSADWPHIPGELHVADFATKYTEFSKLTSTCSWYNGPNFLYERNYLDLLDSKDYKRTLEPKTQINLIEQKVEQPLATNNLPLIFYYSKYSSFQKLIRHVAWIIKLKSNWIKSHKDEKDREYFRYLSKHDLNRSKLTILVIAQKQSYPEEYSALSKNKILPQTSSIISLNPIFEDELIRVGGRISKNQLTVSNLNQVIVNKKHLLSRLIVSDHHRFNFHIGREHTLAAIRKYYWIQ